MNKHRDDNEYDFAIIKQRFIEVNEKRVKRIDDDLRTFQREFLSILPLLFHVNHPLLPGYISKDTPRGIPSYEPDKDTLFLAKRMSRSFKYKKVAYRHFSINAIYLMGSSGTIAYNDKSDFDIWICHDEDLENNQLIELQNKTQAIQEWAKSLAVDANIYLVNPKNIRAGEFGFISNESSGSALSVLLLEEFYRTSVLLYGLYPLWWLVPPEFEESYETYVEDIQRKRFIHSKGHIDFGGLKKIQAGEFYGATLWLLYKGISSPYKSILKILLMQVYASEFPNIKMLSMSFKSAVYRSEEDITALDPYIMMLKKVEKFLADKGEDDRVKFARKCFYIKINEDISNKKVKQNWRRKVLSTMIEDWGWSITDLILLDQRNEWKINQVASERSLIISEFKISYRFLSDFSYKHVKDKNLISQKDQNILGRKIYSAFERKPGKIELVYRGIANNLYESHLSLHKLSSDEGVKYWVVYAGVVAKEDLVSAKPLKRFISLMELLCWCYFNKIMNKNTIVGLYENDSDLTAKEIVSLIDNLDNSFSELIEQERSSDDYNQPANIIANATYLNVAIDPLLKGKKESSFIASERNDALKYGSKNNNLAITIEQVYLTSWQEILIHSYKGVSGLMECLKEHMLWSPPSTSRRPSAINAHSFSSYIGNTISNRVEKLFAAVYDCYYSDVDADSIRFVLGVEGGYYILSLDNDNLVYSKTVSYNDLLRNLAQPGEKFIKYIFDSETLKRDVVPLIYRENKAGLVQCFYEICQNTVDIFILDERGSLSYEKDIYFNATSLIRHYSLFFDSVHKRMQYLSEQGVHNSVASVDDVIFYRLHRNNNGHKILSEQAINKYIKTAEYISLQVNVDVIDGMLIYTLYYEDAEFSSLEYGVSLYREVVKYVFSKRESGEKYNIYITDIALSTAILNMSDDSLQTNRYLYFKKKIEDSLKTAIREN